MATNQNPRSYRGLIVGIAAFVVVFVCYTVWLNKSPDIIKQSFMPKVGGLHNQTETTQPLPTLPAPIFGTVTVSADRPTDWKMKEGWRCVFSPPSLIPYDVTVDGEVVASYEVEHASAKLKRTVDIDREHRAGLQVRQGTPETVFCVAIFMGDRPPSDWFTRAKLAGPLDRSN